MIQVGFVVENLTGVNLPGEGGAQQLRQVLADRCRAATGTYIAEEGSHLINRGFMGQTNTTNNRAGSSNSKSGFGGIFASHAFQHGVNTNAVCELHDLSNSFIPAGGNNIGGAPPGG